MMVRQSCDVLSGAPNQNPAGSARSEKEMGSPTAAAMEEEEEDFGAKRVTGLVIIEGIPQEDEGGAWPNIFAALNPSHLISLFVLSFLRTHIRSSSSY